MAMLIEQQDETINVVEQQAVGVNKDMEDGSRQLDTAVISAQKARRKKWICFWITGKSPSLNAARASLCETDLILLSFVNLQSSSSSSSLPSLPVSLSRRTSQSHRMRPRRCNLSI